VISSSRYISQKGDGVVQMSLNTLYTCQIKAKFTVEINPSHPRIPLLDQMLKSCPTDKWSTSGPLIPPRSLGESSVARKGDGKYV
jgi:hypothetical protein